MIGNRVKIYKAANEPDLKEVTITGTLENLDATGAMIMPDSANYQNRIFIPMHKLLEIVDLGRAPGF